MFEEDIEKAFELKNTLRMIRHDKQYIQSNIGRWLKVDPKNEEQLMFSRLPPVTVGCTSIERYIPENSNNEILNLILKEITKCERKLQKELNSLLE